MHIGNGVQNPVVAGGTRLCNSEPTLRSMKLAFHLKPSSRPSPSDTTFLCSRLRSIGKIQHPDRDLVIQGVLGSLLVGLPFFDRSVERRPCPAPPRSSEDSGVAAQLQKQRQREGFIKAPFQPEVVGASGDGSRDEALLAKVRAFSQPRATTLPWRERHWHSCGAEADRACKQITIQLSSKHC